MSSTTTTDSTELQNLIQSCLGLSIPRAKRRQKRTTRNLNQTSLYSLFSFRGKCKTGEVALPGGKRDDEDLDDIATALREAHEEIGLDPSLVTVISVLEPFVTKIGMRVVPVIGFLPDKKTFKPLPNPSEVEEIFDVPLEMFLKDKNRRAEEREHEGQRYLLHYFDYHSEVKDITFLIWALTAGILIRVASIVYQRSPEFQELKPRFWNQNDLLLESD